MLDILMKGGVILWVIILLSFIGAAIIIERLLYFKKTRADEQKLFNRIKATVEKKHYDEALFICESTVSPFTRLMKTGIEHRNYPKLIQKEVLQEAANQEIPHLEKSLSFLGSIAHISPLLGLLGTVTGNIQAFGVLGSFGAVSDPSILARGISEALITTAAGIIVAIPAVIFYNYLVDKVGKILIKMESQVNDMIILLNDDEIIPTDPAE